jgi:hypothetical protein
MARRKKITACQAKRRLTNQGIDFEDDFHVLHSDDKRLVLQAARDAGYRKRRDAPGSTARMYFQYLARKKGC